LIVVDPHSGVPVYRQLIDQVRLLIVGGQLKPGEELPSTRTLSSELGVNPMTVSKAYSLLEREDLAERRAGRPLVVKALGGGPLHERKIERLQESLRPSVRMVGQLGIGWDEALKVFGELLGSDARASRVPGEEPGP